MFYKKIFLFYNVMPHNAIHHNMVKICLFKKSIWLIQLFVFPQCPSNISCFGFFIGHSNVLDRWTWSTNEPSMFVIPKLEESVMNRYNFLEIAILSYLSNLTQSFQSYLPTKFIKSISLCTMYPSPTSSITPTCFIIYPVLTKCLSPEMRKQVHFSLHKSCLIS